MTSRYFFMSASSSGTSKCSYSFNSMNRLIILSKTLIRFSSQGLSYKCVSILRYSGKNFCSYVSSLYYNSLLFRQLTIVTQFLIDGGSLSTMKNFSAYSKHNYLSESMISHYSSSLGGVIGTSISKKLSQPNLIFIMILFNSVYSFISSCSYSIYQNY